MNHMRSKLFIHPLANCAALLACCVTLFAGCQSPSGGKGKRGFASVAIPNRSPEEVVRATVAVFRADGYRDVLASPDDMIFEKTGTGWNQAAYGGWTDAKPVTVRVRAGVDAQADGTSRLWCEAYMVGDAGHSLFEEEHKLTSVRRGPYQDLLNQVAAQLK